MSGYKRVNYYELCRLCTSSEGVKIHIFREDGKRRQLQNKIQICLPLQVCEDDSLPKIVCAGCLEKLEYFYDFRESCVSSEGMLESYFTSMRFSDDLLREGKVYIKEPDKNSSQDKSMPRFLQQKSSNEPVVITNQTPTITQVISTNQRNSQLQTTQMNSNHINSQMNTSNVATVNTNNITTSIPLVSTSITTVSSSTNNTNTSTPSVQNIVQQQPLTVANMELFAPQQIQQMHQVEQQDTQQQIIPQFMISLTRPGSDILQWQIKDNNITERFKILDQLPTILTQNMCGKCKQIFLNSDDLTNHICTDATTQQTQFILPDADIPQEVSTVSSQQQTKSANNDGDIQKSLIESLELDSGKDKKETIQRNVLSLNNSNNQQQFINTNQITLTQTALNSLLTSQASNYNIAFNQANGCADGGQFTQPITIFNNPTTAVNQTQSNTNNTSMQITTNNGNVQLNNFLSPTINTNNNQRNLTNTNKTNFVLTETTEQQIKEVSSPQLSTIQTNAFSHPLSESQPSSNDSKTVLNTTVASTGTSSTSNKSITSAILHICDTCHKTFKRKEHLMQHKKLHSGERPFVCDVCTKSFSRKEHLIRHSISHTGEKCFECEQCHKSFSRKDNLHKHRKTHAVCGPYICEICNKRFILKHYYVVHKLTHQQDSENTENKQAITAQQTTSPVNKTVQKREEKSEQSFNETNRVQENKNHIRNSNIIVQNENNIINLGQITAIQNDLNQNTNNTRNTLPTNEQTLNVLMQNLAQQNMITTNLGQNLVIQNLVPVSSGTGQISDLSQLINNNRLNVGNVNVINNLTITEQSKHLAQILSNQKYRDKYKTNLDAVNMKIENIQKELDANKNPGGSIMTPFQVGNTGGIIFLPAKNSNFILPPTLRNTPTSNNVVIEQKSKKIKYSQANNNPVVNQHQSNNATIVTNLNQISGGKSNVLFSTSSSSMKTQPTTTILSNTIVNALHHNHLFGEQQTHLTTSSASNAQYI